jgi:hypothetical protein
VFRGSGGPLTTIAKTGDFVLGGYNMFHEPAIHGEMVAFSIGRDPYWPGGVFMGNGGPLKTIVRSGDRVPGVDGQFVNVDSPGFNGDAVGFWGVFYVQVQGDYPEGIFQGAGGPLSTVNTDGYEFMNGPAFSNGTVVFEGQSPITGRGVLLRSGDTTTQIYHYGDPISGIPIGPLPGGPTRLSVSGDTVVFAGQSGFPGPGSQIEAVVAVDGGTPTLIAKTGDPAPIGTFSKFLRGFWTGENPSISGATIVFSASYGVDPEDPSEGIFTSTNGVLATVIKSGDPLFGSTITDVMSGRFAIDPEGSGNLAFTYKLADGREGVALARAVVESIPGDYNRNGAVDAADYVIWRNTLGATGTGLAADGNGNDAIDPGDYDVWRANFGQSASSTSIEEIPEPATIAMLGLAMLAVGGFARRRSSQGVTKRAPEFRSRSGSIACRRLAVTSWVVSALICSGFIFGTAAPPAHAQMLEWVRQFGTEETDYGRGVSADDLGNVFVSTSMSPSYDRISSSLRKFDAAGSLQWITQIGVEFNTDSLGVSADGLGNVYISGVTGGKLGPAACNACDAFVSKYDAAGTLLWTRQLATVKEDNSTGVSADRLGNVYISGETHGALNGPNSGSQDAFLSKYDAAGNLLWTRQFGTARDDYSEGIAADGLGNVYITGFSADPGPFGTYNEPNSFLSKYDATGDLQWQIDTSELHDRSNGVSADRLGNIFITGNFLGQAPPYGQFEPYDAFVSNYDAAGSLQWTSRIGTTPTDIPRGVSADGIGNVYISGTRYEIDQTGDAFFSKFDAAGTLLSTRTRDSAAYTYSSSVAADSQGNVYITGSTLNEVFVAKYVIPEPASWLLAALAGAGVLAFGRCWRSVSRTVVIAVLFWIGSLLLVAPAVGETIAVIVPGTSDPWLAGMSSGSRSSLTDVAPAQSPVHLAGDFAQPTLSFAASGLVSNGGCGLPYCPTNGPDGGETPERPFFPHDNGAENGISDARIPLNALVGVFLNASQPNLTPAPSPLDFSTPSSRDYLAISPGLKQVFFIGDGLRSTGETQQVLIPAGATRLFLGTMDGCCNNDNSGSFTVHVTGIIPEPSAVFLLSVGALAVVRCGPVRIPKRRKNVSMVRNRFGCR